ncbi:MAG: hypothetical protein HF982_12970 [Desulfobacteraceae bacterium]|nr:hypothetical protein [Desulfobacteraceae bacterium]MBC2720471.1 alkaline phosphatase family protein [Desulfobacteraceae bacterium]
MRKLVLFAILSGLIGTLLYSTCGAYETENVFIVVIDGVRNQEAFEDPTHQYIPHIWNDLRPKGTIYRNFYNVSNTSTCSGHAVITSGVEQYIPLNYREGYGVLNVYQKEPSIFEYYRKQLGIPKEKTWIVNGKGSQMGGSGQSMNPRFGPDYAPNISFWPLGRPDPDTWEELQRVMDMYHPSLVLVNLRDVDNIGHKGVWEDYVDAIKLADSIVYEIYNKIQDDPVYKDKTTFILTTDHGRHSDGVHTGFKDHGCHCYGCRSLIFLAMGPDIKQNAVINTPATLANIAPTVGELMDFETPSSEGNVLWEMLKDGSPLIVNQAIKPSVAVSNDYVHLVHMGKRDRSWNIYYMRSQVDGKTRQSPVKLNKSGKICSDPVVVADGHRVAVAWSIYEDLLWKVVLRQSSDNGSTWSDEKKIVQLEELSPIGANLTPQSMFNGDYLELVWNNFLFFMSHNRFLGEELLESSAIQGKHMKCPTLVSHDSVNHVSYYKYDYETGGWEIFYTSNDGTGWLDALRITNSPKDSIDPSIAADDYAVHVVWADSRDGHFEVYYKRSFDGTQWTEARQLSASGAGAWNPAIVSTPKGLAVIWEDYRHGIAQIYKITSIDGGTTWSDPEPVKSSNYHCVNPSVAADTKGDLFVVWQQYKYETESWFINIEKVITPEANLKYQNSVLWTGIIDSKVVNDHAYCAFWNGLGILDVSDRTNPVLLSRVYLHGTCRAIDVNGSYAYIADDWSGLQIVNISNPTNPVQVGSWDTPGVARDVFLNGIYAYVADGPSGLQIIDISEPSAPVKIGSFNTAAHANGVYVEGNYAYVAEKKNGMEIIDISDPHNPGLVGHYPSYKAYKIHIQGNHAYIADGENGLEIVDVSDPSNPAPVGHYDAQSLVWDIFVESNTAYAVDRDRGLFILDITDPANPTLAGAYTTTPDNWAYAVHVCGSYAYLSDGWTDAMSILDISNPASPALAGQYSTAAEFYGITIDKNYAYAATDNGIWVLDTSDLLNPVSVGYCETPGYAKDSCVKDGYLYVADSPNLQVIDVRNPSNPTIVGHYDTPGSAFAVDRKGDFLYVADLESGLQILNISDPINPIWAGSYGHNVWDVCVTKNYAYLASGKTGLEIVDISNPTNPVLIGCYDTPGAAIGVTIDDAYAFVADGESGLHIIDISNPSNPMYVGQYDTPGQAFRIYACNDYVYISEIDDLGHKKGTLQVIDVSDPQNPMLAESYNTPGMPFNMTGIYSLIYLADFASLMIMHF